MESEYLALSQDMRDLKTLHDILKEIIQFFFRMTKLYQNVLLIQRHSVALSLKKVKAIYLN